MSERKHADLWNELVDEAAEAEIDRAASVSVAQAEAELAAAGFDVAAERAKANAFLGALERGEDPATPTATATPTPTVSPTPIPTPTPTPKKPRLQPRQVVLRLAWTAASVAAGAALYAALSQPGPVASPPPPAPYIPSVADLVVAANLRREAAAACDAKQWGPCLADLDKARAVDPGGDDAPAVRTLRDQAIAGILTRPR